MSYKESMKAEIMNDCKMFISDHIYDYETFDECWADMYIADETCGNGPHGHSLYFPAEDLLMVMITDADFIQEYEVSINNHVLGKGDEGWMCLDSYVRTYFMSFMMGELENYFIEMKDEINDSIN